MTAEAYASEADAEPQPTGWRARTAGLPLALVSLLLLGQPVQAFRDGLPVAGLLGLAIYGGALLLGASMMAMPGHVADRLRRLDVPSTTGGLWGASVVALACLLIFGLSLVGPATTLETLLRGRSPDLDLGTPSAAGLVVAAGINVTVFLAGPLVYHRYARNREGEDLRERLGLTFDVESLPWGVVWGGVALLVSLGLVTLLSALGLPERGVVSGALFSSIGLPVFLVVNSAAAIGEEVFFRGFLQPRIGLIPQALWFGVAHATYLSIPHILATVVVGLALGLAYKRHETLAVPIVGHFLYNLTLFAVFIA